MNRLTCLISLFFLIAATCHGSEPMSLEGTWKIAKDAQNVGVKENWQLNSPQDTKNLDVPSVLQQAFPDYNGVVWYWKTFEAPKSEIAEGRFLLEFEQVDYFCEVWLNGRRVGEHEGGETPFTLDVTTMLRPAAENTLCVRVVNPADDAIDGFVRAQTPHRVKSQRMGTGAMFNHGGITRGVALREVPAVYVDDLFNDTRVDGTLRAEVRVRNASDLPKTVSVAYAYGSGRNGATETRVPTDGGEAQVVPPNSVRTFIFETCVSNPHLWNLNDPYLYAGTASVQIQNSDVSDVRRERFGFRDFRFSDGYFRLNGKRIYLKSTHTCNNFPVGLSFPHDPDYWRRDLYNLKMMGFNMVRFIWGGAVKEQLDFCDEIGLMVYEESYAAGFWFEDSPQLEARFQDAVESVVLRDRNHPSIVIWGLLNEVQSRRPTFIPAVRELSRLRQLDSGRMVMLNSGRWDLTGDGYVLDERLQLWADGTRQEPHVGFNPKSELIETLNISWGSKRLGLHPGPQGEAACVRWTAPVSGKAALSARFDSLAKAPTTDVHVLLISKATGETRELGQYVLNATPGTGAWTFENGELNLAAGDFLEFLVGPANNGYGADSTGLTATISLDGKTYDVEADFRPDTTTNGWVFGFKPEKRFLDAKAFRPFVPHRRTKSTPEGIEAGTFSNPDTVAWSDAVQDVHRYLTVPHQASEITYLRGTNGDAGSDTPVYFSEYGIGSAADLIRITRHFESLGLTNLMDARHYREKMEQFEADWARYRLGETFDRPEDFFAQSLRKNAAQRTLGLTAVRANPNFVGHNLTGGTDHVFSGEGLTTAFRELKPGTTDAVFEAWAPLRWNTFVEPWHVRRGSSVRLEAVLSNEDILSPGKYPARAQVFTQDGKLFFDRTFEVTILPGEPPFAQHCFLENVKMDAPTGDYRFVVTLLKGGAPAAGEFTFHVTDPTEMPTTTRTVRLWNDDPEFKSWLDSRKIATDNASDLIFVTNECPNVPELDTRVREGATVVFLNPNVFQNNAELVRSFLDGRGSFDQIHSWLYLKDEWQKPHPYFAGLPNRGLTNTFFYRELISNVWFVPAPGADCESWDCVAGALFASLDYKSGLTLVAIPHGRGKVVLNTFRLLENRSGNPAAEWILRNMMVSEKVTFVGGAYPPAD